MSEEQRTYCPLCGAMDLRTATLGDRVVAFCGGETPEGAHTVFTVAVVEKSEPKRRPPAGIDRVEEA